MTLWIRVDADVADNPKTGRFATSLGVEIETAVGHLVRLWGKMAEQNSDGSLRGVKVATIESWANWRGKKGRFAECFRRTFVVKGGLVKGWGERQGKLILKQIAHREYMREYRSKTHGDAHGESHGDSHVNPLTVTNTKPKERTSSRRNGHPTPAGEVLARREAWNRALHPKAQA